MKSCEHFYTEWEAIDFFNSVGDLNPEIVTCMDEELNKPVWIVYFVPPVLN